MLPDLFKVASAPAISGLRFRRFRGQDDYPAMLAVLHSSAAADHEQRRDTLEDFARNYSSLTNCDPYRDMILAEIAGELVGYARGWWQEKQDGRIFESNGFLAPEWRRKGIGSALLHWIEDHLRVLEVLLPGKPDCFFQVSVTQHQVGTARLLERAGYTPARHFYNMLRLSLDNIPDFPLPEGVEMRPALPELYRQIWESIDETSQDEWDYTPPSEDAYQAWLAAASFQPRLWQVAWDTVSDRVAGHVLTFINHEENQHFNRRRGYTEGIGVDRAWRRRGLARAMIARSLQAQREAGMNESALAADSDSSSGVIHLYESCGFQVVRRDTIYRKKF